MICISDIDDGHFPGLRSIVITGFSRGIPGGAGLCPDHHHQNFQRCIILISSKIFLGGFC